MRSREDETEIPEDAILITRQQAAALLQISTVILDEWSYLPGFPVIRRGHLVRFHRAALDDWLAEFARSGLAERARARDLPPPHTRRGARA